MFTFHTHTEFCDGKSTINEFCNEAIRLNYNKIGFTSHAPVPFENEWSLDFDKLLNYSKAIDDAKLHYSDRIDIYKGLEVDFIPSYTIAFNQFKRIIKADYFIGSIHLVENPSNGELWFIDGEKTKYFETLKQVFNGDAKIAVSQFFEQTRMMIAREKPDVIGHLDKVKMNSNHELFSENDSWYINEVQKTLEAIVEAGSIVEINSRGIYRGKYHETFPSPLIIKECIRLNIPLTLASDAHHISDLDNGFNLSLKTAIDCNVKEIAIFENDKWVLKPLFLFIKN